MESALELKVAGLTEALLSACLEVGWGPAWHQGAGRSLLPILAWEGPETETTEWQGTEQVCGHVWGAVCEPLVQLCMATEPGRRTGSH